MKSIRHNGTRHGLAHVSPMLFSCPCPELGRELLVRVIKFSDHCYTEKAKASGERLFSELRYALSHDLPSIIRGLPRQKVHQTPEKRNYLHVHPLVSEGHIYQVFFTLKRAQEREADLWLVVESAYQVEARTPASRQHGIRFTVLAHKTYKGEPVRRFAPR